MADDFDRLKAALASRYTIERELGAGGMATVYLAQDLKHERQVAVKVLRPELAAVLGAERFLNEIKVTANLRHPHILPLHDSGQAEGLLYYVMPYVTGESLRDRLNRERQLTIEDALQVTREVADALDHAHSMGVVHRDVKPENILLEACHALIMDFGIARAVTPADRANLTETGLAVGTPTYMSPEQGAGDQELDGRSDLYSLACVLYEALAGEAPHTGPTPQAILARKFAGEVRSLRPLRPHISAQFEGVISRALAMSPADRYATCQDFVRALDVSAASSGGRVRWFSRSHRVAASLIVVAAVLAAGAYFSFRGAIQRRSSVGDRLGVAVFPFRPTGGGAAEWSEALADLLATTLDGTPGVRIADPWSLWNSLRPERAARAESPRPSEAAQLAQRAGVAQFVLGSVLRSGDELNVAIRVYDVGREEPTHTLAASGEVNGLTNLVEELAVGLISRIWRRSDRPDIKTLESYATKSPGALKAYLQAREAMRRGLVEEAVSAIDTALALDSTFALALIQAISVKSWAQWMNGEEFAFMDLAERAARHGDSLTARQRLRVQGVLASVRTDGFAAARAADEILTMDSTDIEAWQNLAYYHLVYGWQYGKDEQDALIAAQRVVELDSMYVPGIMMRTRLALYSRDSVDTERQLRRLEDAASESELIRGAVLGYRAVLAGDDEFDAYVDTIVAGPRFDWIAAFRDLRGIRPERAGTLLNRVLQAARPGQSHPIAEGALGRLWIAEGRLVHVDSLIRAGRFQRNELYRRLQHFLVAATLAGVGDSAVGERAATALADYVPLDSALFYEETRDVWWTGWLLGAYHATVGDTAVARRWQGILGRLTEGGPSKDYRGALQRDLEARLAARLGNYEDALALEHEAYDLWTIHTENEAEAYPAPAIRFQLGMLLREVGRPDSAAALFRSLVPPGTWMGSLTARASLELGQLAEERGELDMAARHYTMALRFWELGDQEVEGWRENARSGLERVLRRRG